MKVKIKIQAAEKVLEITTSPSRVKALKNYSEQAKKNLIDDFALMAERSISFEGFSPFGQFKLLS